MIIAKYWNMVFVENKIIIYIVKLNYLQNDNMKPRSVIYFWRINCPP